MKILLALTLFSAAAILAGQSIGFATALAHIGAAAACAITATLLVALAAILLIRTLSGHWPQLFH